MKTSLTGILQNLELEAKSAEEKEQFQLLSDYLDQLVKFDFNKLVSILYKVDVSEEKAKAALANKKENETNGYILAKLLIEREQQKIKWREKYKTKD